MNQIHYLELGKQEVFLKNSKDISGIHRIRWMSTLSNPIADRKVSLFSGTGMFCVCDKVKQTINTTPRTCYTANKRDI